MFEELGLNVARQDDNGANPRPDNRSGWLEGDAPETPMEELIASQAEANFWDPSTQLRMRKKSKPPAYPSRPRGRLTERSHGGRGVSDIHERLEELRERGLYRRMRMVSGPQGPRVLLDGKRGAAAVLQQLPRPRRPPAGARGGRRGGDALRRRAPAPPGSCRAT